MDLHPCLSEERRRLSKRKGGGRYHHFRDEWIINLVPTIQKKLWISLLISRSSMCTMYYRRKIVSHKLWATWGDNRGSRCRPGRWRFCSSGSSSRRCRSSLNSYIVLIVSSIQQQRKAAPPTTRCHCDMQCCGSISDPVSKGSLDP